MNADILKKFQKYFGLKEVVDKQVYDKYSSYAWSFFDIALLEVMIWVREGIGKPITVNNWANGGKIDSRGYRCNLDSEVLKKTLVNILYCTAHGMGKALDFDVKGMKAEEVRQWIRKNIDTCPHPIRMEKDVDWVHIDTCNITDKKLYEFKV